MTMLVPERNAIRAAQEGNEDACRELYKKYKPDVYRQLLLLGVPYIDVEDLIQEVFMGVFMGEIKFDAEKGSFSTWLWRIAYNKAMDYFRRQRVVVSIDSLADVPAKTTRKPEEYLALEQWLRKRTNINDKLLIELLGEYTQAKISSITGWTPNELRHRISRLRSKLKDFKSEVLGRK
jgi:RNA polymerase sigma-70 factor (ECF subfamily)